MSKRKGHRVAPGRKGRQDRRELKARLDPLAT